MGSAQVNQSRAKLLGKGGVPGMFGVEFVFEVGDVVGVAGVFFLDAFADCEDLVCWRLVLELACCGFLSGSSGRGVELMSSSSLVV